MSSKVEANSWKNDLIQLLNGPSQESSGPLSDQSKLMDEFSRILEKIACRFSAITELTPDEGTPQSSPRTKVSTGATKVSKVEPAAAQPEQLPVAKRTSPRADSEQSQDTKASGSKAAADNLKKPDQIEQEPVKAEASKIGPTVSTETKVGSEPETQSVAASQGLNNPASEQQADQEAFELEKLAGSGQQGSQPVNHQQLTTEQTLPDAAQDESETVVVAPFEESTSQGQGVKVAVDGAQKAIGKPAQLDGEAEASLPSANPGLTASSTSPLQDSKQSIAQLIPENIEGTLTQSTVIDSSLQVLASEAGSDAAEVLKALAIALQTQIQAPEFAAALSVDRETMVAPQLLKPGLELAESSGLQQKAMQPPAQVQPVQMSDGAALKNSTPQTTSDTQRAAQRPVTRAVLSQAMEKVEAVLSEVARSRDGSTISLRLDPPSLGTVKVDVTLKEGVLHARLVAETPQVSMMLRERAHDLQATLRRLGLDVEHVSVSVGSDGNLNQWQDRMFEGNSSSKSENTDGSWYNVREASAAVASAASSEAVLDHWIA